MKRFFFVCILIVVSSGCSLTTACSDDPACTRVLFIGNSYTFVNDLPGMFTKLAKAGKHRVETDILAQGGWMLSDHAKSSETLDTIESSQWDFVVLQEQSQIPASRQVRNAQMYPAARTLVGQIRKAGAEPIFFVAWAHQSGWAEAGLPSYENMQSQINAGYQSIGDEQKAILAPVGYAWQAALKQNPSLNLWQDDGSHPSEAGTYLAACVFYAVVFRASPEGLSYRNNLSKEGAQALQKIAADTVLNDTAKWRLP